VVAQHEVEHVDDGRVGNTGRLVKPGPVHRRELRGHERHRLRIVAGHDPGDRVEAIDGHERVVEVVEHRHHPVPQLGVPAVAPRLGREGSLRRATRRRRDRTPERFGELQLDGAPPQWLPDVQGVELVERANGDVRLLVDRDVDPQNVLAAAERTASVVEFSYGPPSLAELFLELVEQ